MVLLDRYLNTKEVFYFLWWFLWVSSVVLIRVNIRELGGERTQIPHGYYIFYVITAIACILLSCQIKLNTIKVVDKQFLAALLFLLMTLVSSALLADQGGAIPKVMLALFVATAPFVLLGRKSLIWLNEKVMDPVLAVAVICAFGACWLTLTGPLILFEVVFENYLHDGRWSFLFQEAGGLAWILAAGITALMFRLNMSHSLIKKGILATTLLPFLLVVFWQTNARASLLWILVALCCYGSLFIRGFFEACKQRDQSNYFFFALGLFAALCLVVLVIFWKDIANFPIHRKGFDITSGRMQVWLVILEEFKKHPFLGFGYGAATTVIEAYDFPEEAYAPMSPLNVFVGVLGEAGLLGLIALLWLWGGAVWKCWQVVLARYDSHDQLFHYAFFIMVMLLGIAAQQNGEWAILFPAPLHFLFFFLIGAAWSLTENHSSTHTHDM